MDKYDLAISLHDYLKPIINIGLELEYNFSDDKYYIGIKGIEHTIFYSYEACLLCYQHNKLNILNDIIYKELEELEPHNIQILTRNFKLNSLLN